MSKPDNVHILDEALVLDKDILELLADNQQEATIPAALNQRMRRNIMTRIEQEAACSAPGFSTVRAAEGEWIEAAPGARIKILRQGIDDGPLTYLAQLEAGFELHGHGHLFEEECIVLEGDLSMGDLQLNAGDYHYAQAGVKHGTLRSENGALVYLRGPLPV